MQSPSPFQGPLCTPRLLQPLYQAPSSAPVLILLRTILCTKPLTSTGALSLSPIPTTSEPLPSPLCISHSPGHRDFSSPGATFTLAPGSALPLNHNTAIQHMPPSYSSSLTLQTTAKNFTIVPQRAETRNLATTAAL